MLEMNVKLADSASSTDLEVSKSYHVRGRVGCKKNRRSGSKPVAQEFGGWLRCRGSAHHLDDLFGDRGLADSVHIERERVDQFAGIF